MQNDANAIALIECSDRKGIVAAVSGYLHEIDANIVQADEYAGVDGRFFMRLEFTHDRAKLPVERLGRELLGRIGDREGSVRVYHCGEIPRMGLLVSKADHCLVELLYRWRAGELPVAIPFVAGNHPDLEGIAAQYGVPFHHVPVEAGKKDAAERRLLELAGGTTDFLVLARYMQIISREFIEGYGRDIVNIHHSFLPSFAGADPYRQAWERGVKIIGATAHYVTEHLDEGPIIEQIVERVSHRDGVETLRRKGKNLERQALYNAILAHVERRIIRYRNKTIVFA